MRTVTELRHTNFLRLFETFKQQVWASWPDEPERGMLRRMSKTYRLSERYLSHVKCGRKPIGHATARKLETLFGLSVGWMDAEHTQDGPKTKAEDQFIASVLMLYRMAPMAAQKEMLCAIERQLQGRKHGGATEANPSKKAKETSRRTA